MKPKLSSTVSVVKLNDSVLEFFKTNTRQQVRIRVEDDTIMNIVCSLDGSRDLEDAAADFSVSADTLQSLLAFLQQRGLLDSSLPHEDFPNYASFRRVINFLQDYATSHEQLVDFWNRLRGSTVLIVGLGAVGSWVTANLAQSGVRQFVLMDNDVVEASNLHRQFGYRAADIGRKKADVLSERIYDFSSDIEIDKRYLYLEEDTLHVFDNMKLDLIINCADQPTVDATSLWVGEYAMGRGIPHIVGGGYNLHLSLIGQTILPGKSACAKCFQKQLEEDNKIDPARVKKLIVQNRSIGSFGPMCSLIASMVGMEAIKILTGCTEPANCNRRGEFNIYTMDVTYHNFERRDDCEWCGTHGRYYHKECDGT